MTKAQEIYLFAGSLFLVFLFIYWCWRSSRRTRIKRLQEIKEAYSALTQAHGWQYLERDETDLPYRFSGKPFNIGYDRAAQYIVFGDYRGYRMIAYTYIYYEKGGMGDDAREDSVWHSVVVLDVPPSRRVRHPESLTEQRSRKLSYRFDGSSLVVWRKNQLEADEVTPLLDYACDVLDRAYV